MKFQEILDKYGIDYKTENHHHCRPGWIQFDCPFCGKHSKKYHMGFSVHFHFTNCWKCGGHSLFSVLQELLNVSSSSASKIIKNLDIERPVEEKVRGTLKIPYGVSDLLPIHKQYLMGRNIDPEYAIKTWKIRGLSQVGKLSWRIFIPIHFKEEVVSWTTRTIRDSSIRYLSALAEHESIPHKSLLYGEDYAKDTIIVCEGPLDVWKIGKGAVATFGTSVSASQILKMIKYPNRIICMDQEPNAQKTAQNICDTLSLFPGETYNLVLDSKDPGSASEKEIKKIREKFLKSY